MKKTTINSNNYSSSSSLVSSQAVVLFNKLYMKNLITISGKAQSGKNTIASIIQYLIWHSQVESKEKALAVYSIKDFLKNNSLANSLSGWEQKSFAGKIKEILSTLTGIPVKDFEKEEIKNSYLSEEWNRWKPEGKIQNRVCYTTAFFATKIEAINHGKKYFETDFSASEEKITVRQALQWIGTELFRDKFHPNTWTNALFADYKYPWVNKAEWDFNRTGKYNKEDLKFPKWASKWVITDLRFKNEAQAVLDRGGILIRINRPIYEYWYDADSEMHYCELLPKYAKKVDSICTPTGTASEIHTLRRPNFTHNKESIIKEFNSNISVRLNKHLSETSLDDYNKFHYTIDNTGSIEDLIEKVREILIKENII